MAAFLWADLLSKVAALNYGGYTDWRVPSWKEALNLINTEPADVNRRLGDGAVLSAYYYPYFNAYAWTASSDYLYSADPTNCAMTIGLYQYAYPGGWYGYKTAHCLPLIVRDA